MNKVFPVRVFHAKPARKNKSHQGNTDKDAEYFVFEPEEIPEGEIKYIK